MAAGRTKRSDKINRNVLRLLDANLNRAREGLRVLEDTSRFIWGNKNLFKQLKQMRHGLDRLTRLHYPELLQARHSEGDAGRSGAEEGRKDTPSVVAANFRRCEESMRVLEEYGKILSVESGYQFKKIRFRMYDLEKKVLEILTKPSGKLDRGQRK